MPVELSEVLPEGFTVEICPTAEHWWRAAAGALESGKLMAIDYGLTQQEFFAPERGAGTLRTYRYHRAGRELLARPGEQDITAQVNFTAMRLAGETAGLRTEGFWNCGLAG